jgi:uncharacterized protein (DUF58 family)
MAQTPLAEGASDSTAMGPFDADFLRRLEQLEIIARKVFRGQLRGERITRRRGRGLEFSDFRAYQPGDDLRYIDWNVSARLDRLFLKLHSADEDMALHVVVDSSASMALGEPSKFDQCRRLAAAFAYLGLANLDRVTLSFVASAPALSSRPLRGRRQMLRALEFLIANEPAGQTNFDLSLRTLAAAIPRRGMVLVLSDLLSPEAVAGDSLWAGVKALRRAGHDVMMIQVLDENEIVPPLDGPLELVDSETGELLRLSADDSLRDAYLRYLDKVLDELQARARREGVSYLRVSNHIDFEDVVLRYLRHARMVT